MKSKRGCHLQPFGYHGFWLPKADEWLERMHAMGIEVAVLCSAGDGGMEAAEVLASSGIQPVMRFTPSDLPRPFPHMKHVETFVEICQRHGYEAIVQAGNEPGDGREWVKDTPPDWFTKFGAWWCNAAKIITERGGVAGFPDGPCYPTDPFPMIDSTWGWWESGQAIYLGHFYGLNRPLDYPYDDVARLGRPPLTEEQHRAALGRFYDLPGWREPLEQINHQRMFRANPWLTALDDDTCWRGWERVESWMLYHFGKVLRMALTEGGWTPGAQAGDDIRWPKPIPETVADYTVQALAEDTPLEFQAFWLLGDSTMGGSGGWDGDAWVTGTYMHLGYNMELPVVDALRGTEPEPPDPPEPPEPDARALIRAAKVKLNWADCALSGDS